MRSASEALGGVFGILFAIAAGMFYFAASVDGITNMTGMHWLIACFVNALLVMFVPAALVLCAFVGMVWEWGWPWWGGLLAAAPGLVFSFLFMGISGIVSMFSSKKADAVSKNKDPIFIDSPPDGYFDYIVYRKEKIYIGPDQKVWWSGIHFGSVDSARHHIDSLA